MTSGSFLSEDYASDLIKKALAMLGLEFRRWDTRFRRWDACFRRWDARVRRRDVRRFRRCKSTPFAAKQIGIPTDRTDFHQPAKPGKVA